MTKRTVEQVKASAAEMLASNEITGEDIKAKSSLVNFNLTPEQVAFCIASTEDDVSDDGWRTLLTECYTGTEQGVVDAAWNMTGFDGTDEDRVVLETFITAFKAAHDDRPPNLSLNALFDILTDADNRAENPTMDDWLDKIEEAEDDAIDRSRSTPMSTIDIEQIKNVEASATAIGDELAKDEELQTLLTKTADTSQFLKIAPVLLMQRIEKHYGDAMDGWPVPGSKHPKGVAKDGNVLYDRYQSIQGTKKKMFSFYGQIFSRFGEGVNITRELAEIERGDDGRYMITPTSGWTLAKRNGEKKTLEKRLKDQTKYFGDAVRLHQQLSWLNTFPGCTVDFDTDVDGSLRRTTTPFILTPVTNGKKEEKYAAPMTIGDVLRFDRDKAMTGIAGKAGGTWDALLETKKRIQTPEQAAATLAEAKKLVEAAIKDGRLSASGTLAPTAQATEVGLIKNVQQLTSYVSMMAHFGRDMAEAEPDAPLVKEFTKAIATDDDLVMSWADVIKLADSIRPRVEVRKRQIEAKELQAKGNGNGTPAAKTA